MTTDVARGPWRKSSRSGAGNDCVELLVEESGAAIRDSKAAGRGHLRVAAPQWLAFLGAVKGDALDAG